MWAPTRKSFDNTNPADTPVQVEQEIKTTPSLGIEAPGGKMKDTVKELEHSMELTVLNATLMGDVSKYREGFDDTNLNEYSDEAQLMHFVESLKEKTSIAKEGLAEHIEGTEKLKKRDLEGASDGEATETDEKRPMIYAKVRTWTLY